MKQHLRKFAVLVFFVAASFLLSFTIEQNSSKKIAQTYEKNITSLVQMLNRFHKAANAHAPKDSLIQHFYRCRNLYKHVELFVDLFTPATARLLNGPDILRISDDSPLDSLKPHGFQVVERLLFQSSVDISALTAEIKFTKFTLQELLNSPGSEYYFDDAKIWLAMRLAVFKVVSMGITGFDVPISFHAIPETREVLTTIKATAAVYKAQYAPGEWQKGSALFSKADAYLSVNSNFNTFDRLNFIRNYINPISEWLTFNGNKFLNTIEHYPLNPLAAHLFAYNIINVDFFSPNPDYYLTTQRIALGKRLFYDPILSGNGSRSCASCHKPELAFTDGLAKAIGLEDELLLRNTPTLWNAALQTAQFYDGRARGLERQMDMVVHNPGEMNGSVIHSMPLIKSDSVYVRLFSEAYREQPEAITEYNIGNAVASYIRSLVSFNSRFDRYIRKETDSLTLSEKNGFNLFMGKARCGTCHYAPLFNGLTPPLYQDTEFETLAVPASSQPISMLDADEGKFFFTQQPFHKYAFKTLTVRNISLTAPYMHNGVFKTLEEVIDFYNDGGGAGRGINLPTQTLPTDKLGLTKKEKQDIIAFLHTLTDTSLNN
jgi:cytochrome c peroxidase